MKLLLTGKNGQVGFELQRALAVPARRSHRHRFGRLRPGG